MPDCQQRQLLSERSLKCSQSTGRVRWVVGRRFSTSSVHDVSSPTPSAALLSATSADRSTEQWAPSPSRPHSAWNTIAPTSTHTAGSIAGENRRRNVTHIRWVRRLSGSARLMKRAPFSCRLLSSCPRRVLHWRHPPHVIASIGVDTTVYWTLRVSIGYQVDFLFSSRGNIRVVCPLRCDDINSRAVVIEIVWAVTVRRRCHFVITTRF